MKVQSFLLYQLLIIKAMLFVCLIGLGVRKPPLESNKKNLKNMFYFMFFRMRAVHLDLVAKVTPTGLVVAVVGEGRD